MLVTCSLILLLSRLACSAVTDAEWTLWQCLRCDSSRSLLLYLMNAPILVSGSGADDLLVVASTSALSVEMHLKRSDVFINALDRTRKPGSQHWVRVQLCLEKLI